MASNFVIPQNQEQLNDTAKIILRNTGFGLLKTAIYDRTIPKDYPQQSGGNYNGLQGAELGNTENARLQSGLSSYNASFSGAMVFSNLEFPVKGKTFLDAQLNEHYFDEDLRFDTVLFNVAQQKNIIRTPVQGKDGDIIEYIGKSNYSVDIKGVFTAPNGYYPYYDVLNYCKIMGAGVELPVKSWYLNDIWNIHNLVVTFYSNPNGSGTASEENFEIQAISDEPTILRIKKR